MTGHDQHDDAAPAYGYGAGGRPLGSDRDRHAEQLRELLRAQDCPEFDDDRDGFVVDAPDDGPMLLVYTGDTAADRAAADARYRDLLDLAGYRIEPDATGDGDGWKVWPGTQPDAGDTAGTG